MQSSYKITSRSAELGGSWRLQLLEGGAEAGGVCSRCRLKIRMLGWLGGTA